MQSSKLGIWKVYRLWEKVYNRASFLSKMVYIKSQGAGRRDEALPYKVLLSNPPLSPLGT